MEEEGEKSAYDLPNLLWERRRGQGRMRKKRLQRYSDSRGKRGGGGCPGLILKIKDV